MRKEIIDAVVTVLAPLSDEDGQDVINFALEKARDMAVTRARTEALEKAKPAIAAAEQSIQNAIDYIAAVAAESPSPTQGDA